MTQFYLTLPYHSNVDFMNLQLQFEIPFERKPIKDFVHVGGCKKCFSGSDESSQSLPAVERGFASALP
jgi:hypothetical protein